MGHRGPSWRAVVAMMVAMMGRYVVSRDEASKPARPVGGPTFLRPGLYLP